ncbi:MAG: Do family serine endopeptidase [Terriglobia bacterium]
MDSRGWNISSPKRKWEIRLALVVTLAVGILLGTLITHGVRAGRDDVAPTAKPLSISDAPSPADLSVAFRRVARQVEPAVVNISTQTFPERERRRRSRDLFEFFERLPDFPRPERERSLGSGVIVDPDGYILTNYHVVAGADRIDVRLAEGNESFRARVVGYDQETDLAVIKIDAQGELPAVPLGDSDKVEVGDWVLAIGSPFGLQATVTAGIISYKGRPGTQFFGSQFQSFIQTDAAINRGNSGGPLMNLEGEVIGINTAILSNRGVSAGVGFAMPSNTAVRVYNQIIEHGRVVRGSIGISFRGAASENAAILRAHGAEYGVVVENVVPGGPADKAGLQRGDVITAVNDEPIRSGDELVGKVTSTALGKKVRLSYVRDKKPGEVWVSIEDFSQVHAGRFTEASMEEPGEEEASARLGLMLEELSVGGGTLRRLGLEKDDTGLLVREVELGSFADEIGLRARDLILEFNRERVHTLRDFQALERRLKPGSDVVFWVKRRFGENWTGLYLGGTLPE